MKRTEYLDSREKTKKLGSLRLYSIENYLKGTADKEYPHRVAA